MISGFTGLAMWVLVHASTLQGRTPNSVAHFTSKSDCKHAAEKKGKDWLCVPVDFN